MAGSWPASMTAREICWARPTSSSTIRICIDSWCRQRHRPHAVEGKRRLGLNHNPVAHLNILNLNYNDIIDEGLISLAPPAVVVILADTHTPKTAILRPRA